MTFNDIEPVLGTPGLMAYVECDKVVIIGEENEQVILSADTARVLRDYLVVLLPETSIPAKTEDPHMARVRECLRPGHSFSRVMAIKLYREMHGCSLKEAVEACDDLLGS